MKLTRLGKITAIAFGIALGTVIGITSFTGDKGTITAKEVTVEQGQTLYEVVAKEATPEDNINKVVWEAMKEKGIANAGDIQPGDTFIIYVHER